MEASSMRLALQNLVSQEVKVGSTDLDIIRMCYLKPFPERSSESQEQEDNKMMNCKNTKLATQQGQHI